MRSQMYKAIAPKPTVSRSAAPLRSCIGTVGAKIQAGIWGTLPEESEFGLVQRWQSIRLHSVY